MKRISPSTIFRYSLLIIITGIMIFPFYWMLISSVKIPEEFTSYPPTLFPKRITFEFYIEILQYTNVLIWLENSTIVSLMTTSVVTLIACLGAYGISRFRFLGKRIMSNLIVLVYIFPPIMLLIPLYDLMNKLGIVHSFYSLLIVYVAFNLPTSLWILKAFFDTIPTDLEEASMIDGCSRIEALFRIVMPLAAPAIAAAAIFSFIMTWNEFMFASLFLTSSGAETMAVGIVDYSTALFRMYWQEVMALGTISCLPGFLFAFFLQKYLVAGLTKGAVKR